MNDLDDWLKLAPQPLFGSGMKWHVFLSYRSSEQPGCSLSMTS